LGHWTNLGGVSCGYKKVESAARNSGHNKRFLSILEDIRSKQLFPAEYLQGKNLEDVMFRADYHHVRPMIQTARDRSQENNNNTNDDADEEEEEENDISNCRYCDRTKVIKRTPHSEGQK
jgi:hypothetical protein